ncbi:fluoride efflux transporter CrcB [Rubrobacter indicoceani]|uniref:fluoride efflux transporter CrcB n=1 Tax=Rubrobacter indicoceani TaxID=2051957 RepID=UPI000E5B719A|nr:fluoride efflux transporter CrcB [Rubrobacter indicoceani]
MKNLILVALGGGIGAALRYGVGLWLASSLGPGFPWGTFFVNVTGSFVIGVALALVAGGQLPSEARLFLAVGLMGGYTTFSSYSYETLVMISSGSTLAALMNVFGQLVLGFSAVYVGVVVGRIFGGA